MKQRLSHTFDFRFKKANLLKPSVIALLAANLYPLFGVIFLNWDTFFILVLFWMENLVIGFYTIIKMVMVPRENSGWAAKIFTIPFFCLHYGIFTLAHGIFIFALFGNSQIYGGPSAGTEGLWGSVISPSLFWGALALFLSHGISLYQNYIKKKEYLNSNVKDLMQQPYNRVVILHITIIFGGFLIAMLGSPAAGLVLLVVLKTAIDIRAHLREHDKYQTQNPPETIIIENPSDK